MGVRNEINPIQRRAYELYKSIQDLVQSQAALFLELGKALKTVRDEKLYRQIGEGGYETFGQFLNNPEIGLPQSTAYLYIRVYEYYVQRLGLPEKEVIEVPINRLMRLLPSLKQREDQESREIVSNIGKMTNYDYGKEVQEKQLEILRPQLYREKESGMFILEFDEGQLQRVVMHSGQGDERTSKILYEWKG